MKNGVLIPIVALLFATLGVALDNAVDFSGKWALENSEQSLQPAAPMKTVGPAAGPMSGGDVDVRNGGDGSYRGGEGSLPSSFRNFSAPDLVISVTQTAAEINIEKRWTVDGQPLVSSENYKLDGKENAIRDSTTNMVGKSRAKWRKGGLTIDIVQQVSAGSRIVEVRVKQEYSLSKDSQVLSIKTTQEIANGQVVIKQTFRKS
jgi:hypothetical protein